MRIEKEIPKSYFRNQRHKALVNILFTSNWIIERLKQFLEREDITHQQYNILRILNNSDTPLSTLKIREQMLDKMSDTSRIVERLLKKELVNKQICAQDKRLVDVTISKKGVQLLQRLEEKVEWLDSITSNLTSEETDTVNLLLDKIREKE
ncbi:MAG: regulatory protein MarR [Segetibacter sp.]|jgi:DNA-binding MarR family transcriptional regulator|nr:regulatory protein MarR [Segetibacter sp.]